MEYEYNTWAGNDTTRMRISTGGPIWQTDHARLAGEVCSWINQAPFQNWNRYEVSWLFPARFQWQHQHTKPERWGELLKATQKHSRRFNSAPTWGLRSTRPQESAVVEGNTCYVEVGGHFAVGQGEPDESQTHTESSRHVGQIVAFTWNTNTCWLLNVHVILKREHQTCWIVTFSRCKTACPPINMITPWMLGGPQVRCSTRSEEHLWYLFYSCIQVLLHNLNYWGHICARCNGD